MSIAQPDGVFGTEEREDIYDLLLSPDRETVIEQFAGIATDFLQRLNEGESEAVKIECMALIEWCFQHSDSYKLALRIYANRFNTIGASSPAEVFQLTFDRHIGEKGEAIQ